MWRWTSLLVVFLFGASVNDWGAFLVWKSHRWTAEDLARLAPQERAAIAIWRLAVYSVAKYADFYHHWNLEDFLRSDFNLLKEVPNPYTGRPVRWGSRAPGDVDLTAEGERLALTVRWARRPTAGPERYDYLGKPALLRVFADPRGWFLTRALRIPRPASHPLLLVRERKRRARLEALQGADRRWYLLCTYLSAPLRRAAELWGLPQLRAQGPTLAWWAVPPGLKNPYTGEPLRVAEERTPGGLTMVWNGAWILFCWDRQQRDIRGRDTLADRLLPPKEPQGAASPQRVRQDNHAPESIWQGGERNAKSVVDASPAGLPAM